MRSRKYYNSLASVRNDKNTRLLAVNRQKINKLLPSSHEIAYLVASTITMLVTPTGSDAMDLSNVISDQSARQAEKLAFYVSQIFDDHSDLSEIFTQIANREPELCQQILSKSEACIKSWFLTCEDFPQAVKTLALLAPVYGPEPTPDSLSQTWLLPAVRCCLNGMEHAFHFDSETVSRKVATHLLNLNPAFTQCESLEETRKLLNIMFGEQKLHWSVFVNK